MRNVELQTPTHGLVPVAQPVIAAGTGSELHAPRSALEPLLLFEHVSKWYGTVLALNQVTLELTGGLRYFHDRTRTKPFSVLNNANAVLIDSKATSSKVSPRVVLTWLPSRDLTFYASYSEGFRGGFRKVRRSSWSRPALARSSRTIC